MAVIMLTVLMSWVVMKVLCLVSKGGSVALMDLWLWNTRLITMERLN